MKYNSIENRKLRSSQKKNFPPIKPYSCEIYNAFISHPLNWQTENWRKSLPVLS